MKTEKKFGIEFFAVYVRSFTGVEKDNFEAQGRIVANSLPGWKSVDVATIAVEDKSGMGGSRQEYF